MNCYTLSHVVLFHVSYVYNMHGIIQYATIAPLLLIIGYEHIVNVNILIVALNFNTGRGMITLLKNSLVPRSLSSFFDKHQ